MTFEALNPCSPQRAAHLRSDPAAAPGLDPQARLLAQGRLDFSGAQLVVARLLRDLENRSARMRKSNLDVLAAPLGLRRYRRQKQAYFLFREVAGGLARAAAAHVDPALGVYALSLLERRLGHRHYGLHRAVAEALGGLPLAITPPVFSDGDVSTAAAPSHLPELNHAWLRAQGFVGRPTGHWIGRSFVLDGGPRGQLVIKALRAGESPASLANEACWMRRLDAMRSMFARPFAIPTPLGHRRGYLWRWAPDGPGREDAPPGLHAEGHALVFTVAADYFHYPNHPVGPRRLSAEQVCETLGRCECLLGRALAHDVLHTAPIPLLNNSNQQHRRVDDGVYDWPRAGRLDQWLDSCRYPNLARSGLRDFEHFRLRADTAFSRYEWIGVHLISLFLVAGSYFRAADPKRVGTDAKGRPMDTRDLFDPALLAAMILSVCTGYRLGFVGRNGTDALPFDLETVVGRMIEEMGVDRHMEEVLRVVDQKTMKRSTFERFLVERGIDPAEVPTVAQGQVDIVLQTGPHLGDFNQPISLPELTHITGAVSADCVARRFRLERGWPPSVLREDEVVENQTPEGRSGRGAE